jgi:predicted RNA binding protein YcfA (HicA-like mRNA interferase family)
MPRIHRNVSGAELARELGTYGYHVARQTGTHFRLTRNVGGPEQHLTIPRHSTLRVGTLARILSEVAVELDTTKEALILDIFD